MHLQRCPLFHHNLSAKLLHGSDDFLSVLLWNVLLHHLWCALDELLAIDQTEAEQALDLLDDLGLGGGIELLQLQGEQSLLGGGGSSVFGLFSGRGGGGSSSSEATNRHVRDVELALEIRRGRVSALVYVTLHGGNLGRKGTNLQA